MSLHITLSNIQKSIQNLADNKRMVCEKTDDLNDHAIKEGNASIGVVKHGEDQTAENNRIRQDLLEACKVQFGVKRFADMPESVRKAFKVGAFKDDLKLQLDKKGDEKVTSGRPLTARRIRRVIDAVLREVSAQVDRYTDVQQGERMAWADYSAAAQKDGKTPNRKVCDYFCAQAKLLPKDTLKLFDKGVSPKSVRSFAKAIHNFERTLYADMPKVARKAAKGGDGEICRCIFIDAVVGRLSEKIRCQLADYINTDECKTAIKADIDELTQSDLTDDAFREAYGAIDYAEQLRKSVANFFTIPLKVDEIE